MTDRIERARAAAIGVLRNNRKGPHRGLFRTAAWGYPEPYTRDIMLSSLGILRSGDRELVKALGEVLAELGARQSERGHIPSLAHDSNDRGASDTTPLFLIALALYRKATGRRRFLQAEAAKALRWMEYQSPGDRVIVAQQPTSDWRDEQWVVGFGLYVNALVHAHLKLWGETERSAELAGLMNGGILEPSKRQKHVHEGLTLRRKPYYGFWAYKIYSSERFDLLGNSLAILSGLASRARARRIVTWVETECAAMRRKGAVAVDLPPNFFPFIVPGDPDWRPRYEEFNQPGDYHNGGVWPFVCGLYVAAVVAAGFQRLAHKKLDALTDLVTPSRRRGLKWGFNEWIKAQDGAPMGQDWQTWSAAMYVYAADCVRERRTPFFDEIRGW